MGAPGGFRITLAAAGTSTSSMDLREILRCEPLVPKVHTNLRSSQSLHPLPVFGMVGTTYQMVATPCSSLVRTEMAG